MARIAEIETGFYRIPLSITLSDSTHGEIKAFELLTVRVRDSDGAEGVGYTYTVGRNGGAVADIMRRELPELVVGLEADDTEALWQHVWWRLHYGGRGGPTVLALSALDIAVWDLKAKRAALPLWRLLGGFDANVPCYAGGIDLDLPVDALLKQTDDNLGKGFRAIKMKVGRPDLGSDVARVAAMRKHLGDGFPLMADANMKWTVEEAIRAARALQPYDLTWLEEPIIPDDVAGHARILASRRRADRCGRKPPDALGIQELHRERCSLLSGAGCHQLRRRHLVHEDRASGRSVQSSGHEPRRA